MLRFVGRQIDDSAINVDTLETAPADTITTLMNAILDLSRIDRSNEDIPEGSVKVTHEEVAQQDF